MTNLHKIPGVNNLIFGHAIRQTRDAEFLCVHDVYHKLHRPNFYDIGGTYMEDIPHYWFTCKTEKHTNIFLLHIFVINHSKGTFNIALSSGSTLTSIKGDKSFLPHYLREYRFTDSSEKSNIYIATYSFSDLDVDMLKNKKLYIYIAFPPDQHKLDKISVQWDFCSLLTEPFESDFTIESEDGESFKVHKKLLSTFSDYFKAMFHENTVESQNNFVKLVGVNGDDLKNILEFIYTGTIKNVENSNCYSLLLLADSYNVKGLFELVESTLALQMTKDNIIEVLSLADMSNSEILKLTAFKFIKRNASVLDMSIYKELNNSSLTKELCVYLCTSQ